MNFIFRTIIFGTLLFLVIAGAAALYLNTGRNEEEAVEFASELPGTFVSSCQKVSAETDIPWNYLAAYCQVSLDFSNKPEAYPSEEIIRELAGKIRASGSGSIKSKIRALEGRDRADIITDKALALEECEFFYSPEYMFPVEKSKVTYTDTWLAPRDGGKRQHLGTDVFAPEGTPVYAVTDGKISRIGWDNLGGNRVGLRGKDGIYYYFAHLSRYAPGIEKGTKVSKGTVLGYVGHTGNAEGTPDHLHFGMLVGWEKWVNPYNFLVCWEQD